MMMAKIKNPSYFMCIALAQLILLAIVEATPWSLNASSNLHELQEGDRLKRDAPRRPDFKFIMTILDGDEEITITWSEVQRYIVNRKLPVYSAEKDTLSQQLVHRKITVKVPEIIIYHDTKLRSSAMFLRSTMKFEGTIGGTYVISVPLDKLSTPLTVDGNVVKRYAHRAHGNKKCLLNNEDEFPPPQPLIHDVKKRAINSQQLNVSSLRTRRADPDEATIQEHIYLEVLLFITYDAARSYLLEGACAPTTLVNKYIRDFVAIDMIFASIPTNEFKLYVNLAGVIIEAGDGVFAEVTNYPQLKYQNDRLLDIGLLFDDFQSYPKLTNFPFPRDRYDLIMISTGRELQFGVGSVFGWHHTVPDILNDMVENDIPEVPMVIVQRQYSVSDTCYAVREIGKILGISKNDHLGKLSDDDGRQCYGVMQPSHYYCSDCLKWSYESVSQIETFMSENVNHCFLLNKPRSLDPSKPTKSLTPCRQCSCFGYCIEDESSGDVCPLSISPEDCSVPLQCKSKDDAGQIASEATILPMNGTPCGDRKVCWDGACVEVREEVAGFDDPKE